MPLLLFVNIYVEIDIVYGLGCKAEFHSLSWV